MWHVWRGAYRVFVGKPEGNNHLESMRDNIKVDHQEIGLRAQTGLLWLRVETNGGGL
jgi:methyl coenzyme M reductase subunit D